MKLYSAINIYNIYKKLLDDANSNVSISDKFNMLTTVKELTSVVENFETIKNEKINEYGAIGEDGKVFIDMKNNEAFQKFANDMRELEQTDVNITIPKFTKESVFSWGLPTEMLVAIYDTIEND